MKNFLNKTSFSFIFRFALIIVLSFGVLFAVNVYVLNSIEGQTAQTPSAVE